MSALKVGGGLHVVATICTEARVIADQSLAEGDPRHEANPIESFNMGVAAHGVVIFRALDGTNRRNAFAGDGGGLRRIVTALDTVRTDFGPALVRWPRGGSPAFSGSVDINRRWQVAYVASRVTPARTSRGWGLGAFLATPAAGDANGHGAIDIDDFLLLVANY